jgi:dipeptidyl aminopeptidase/acylaminoacyl peptidase
MNRIALLLLFAAGASAQSPVPHRLPKQYTIEQLIKNTVVSGAGFSADEKKILLSSNQTGVFNVWTMPVWGGTPTALTHSTESTFALSYFPKDERVLYRKDQGGNEKHHIYVLAPDGTERDLTPGKEVKARFGDWTHDLSGFYVLSNERDPRFFDIYRLDAKSYERSLLYRDEVGYDFTAVSNDGKWIAFSKRKSTSDSDIYLYDIAARRMKQITPHRDAATYQPQTFDPLSKRLYYLTNEGSEFTRVRYYELSTGKHVEVEKADWDYEFYGFSWNGKYTVSSVNEDGRTRVRMRETSSGREVQLPTLPEGEIRDIQISRSEQQMMLHSSSNREPGNLYRYDFATKKLTRLTDTLNKEVDANDLVDAQAVRFMSFDGMVIPNFLYRPHQAAPDRKSPALVAVHGGPGGQTRPSYSPMVQYLVNHGYVILGINNRGSSGYGKTFFTADDRKHGREPLWDCVEGKHYLAQLPYVDPKRIGILGGSYGGYMVLAALAFKPDVFDVGVDFFGVSNWVRTLKSIPPDWESKRQALYLEIGDPEKDEKMLRAISPLFHATQIRKPLMVLQGANDPRVIKAESDEIVAAVKQNGVPVEYVVFPDEGHGFRKHKNEIEGYGKILEFLDKYLKGTAGGAAASGSGQ